MARAASSASSAKVFVPSGKMLMEQPTRKQVEIKITIVAVIFIGWYLRSRLLNQFQQRKQAHNYTQRKRGQPHPKLQLFLKRCNKPQSGCSSANDAVQEVPALIRCHLSSPALIRPTPAVTAANAPIKSGALPLSSWMPTLDNVATIVRIPSAVVFMMFYCG